MRRTQWIVLLAALAFAAPLGAQAGPRGGTQVGGALQNPAEFLLSHTAALELTDAQVVRLAALARQADARREELRASLQAARPTAPPAQPPPGQEMRQRMQAAREQIQAEGERARAEVIAVLTPEQQAQAWQLIAAQARQAGPMARGTMPQGARERMRARGPQGVQPGQRGQPGQQPQPAPAP